MAKPNGNCALGAEVKARIDILEKRFDETGETFGRIFSELKEIRDLLSGRPTWAVLTIVSILSSTTVGLMVVLFKIIG